MLADFKHNEGCKRAELHLQWHLEDGKEGYRAYCKGCEATYPMSEKEVNEWLHLPGQDAHV
jgi:hypothetical protein